MFVTYGYLWQMNILKIGFSADLYLRFINIPNIPIYSIIIKFVFELRSDWEDLFYT